jgi:uncharacterized surface protein with fasciclin (FAS1) repeats
MEDSNSNNQNMWIIAIAVILIIAIAGGIFLFSNRENENTNNTDNTEQTSHNNKEDANDNQTTSETRTIVEVAVDAPYTSTLVQAVQAGELVDKLNGNGPFTVFAPTNDAFAALPEGTLDNLLLPENKDGLVSKLTFHVVPGVFRAGDLRDGMVLDTVNGETLLVSVENGVVKVNGINVSAADVDASNGVIHLIDGVLIPGQR